jgi:hypothetical protein
MSELAGEISSAAVTHYVHYADIMGQQYISLQWMKGFDSILWNKFHSTPYIMTEFKW